MASNEESHHPSSSATNGPPVSPDPQPENGQTTENNTATTFSHPGARLLAQRAQDGDGPYRCRKCGMGVLTPSVIQCPACLDPHPWFAPADA